MPALKLTDWELEDTYVLLAIHSTVESYRLAYLLNKYLNMQFVRTAYDHDIILTDAIAHYPVYKFEDHMQSLSLYLVPNKYNGTLRTTNTVVGLFSEQEQDVTVKTVLIKEFKDVDYLLKIEVDDTEYDVAGMVKSFQGISQIISVYPVDAHIIKQPDYLIFE